MNKNLIILTGLIFWLVSCNNKEATDPNMLVIEKLSKLEGVSFKTINGDDTYRQCFELSVEQPLDHENPNSEKFTQRVYLSHLDLNKPVVFITEGYSAGRNYISELSDFIQANQIIVEHRFFGKSVPDSIKWNFLNLKQATADLHRINKLLKSIYKEKWVSSGISKGGQTSISYRYFYPEDVSATVPYVAPLNLKNEDPRLTTFISEKVANETDRKAVSDFQKKLLLTREFLMPEFKVLTQEKNYNFSILGEDAAFEFAVLEFSFAFWQWGYFQVIDIPTDFSNPKEIITFLDKTDAVSFFTDESIQGFRPFFYQALTEMGMYNYDTTAFSGLLKYVKDPNFNFTFPENTEKSFNKELMPGEYKWLKNKALNFVFIYGSFDPWFATAPDLSQSNGNHLFMVKEKGNHRTRIKSFTEAEQQQIKDSLYKWLDIK